MYIKINKDRLIKARKNKGITQVELCKMVHMPRTTYALIESGTTKSININVLRTICKILQVDINDIAIQHIPISSSVSDLSEKIKEDIDNVLLFTDNIKILELYDNINSTLLADMISKDMASIDIDEILIELLIQALVGKDDSFIEWILFYKNNNNVFEGLDVKTILRGLRLIVESSKEE